MTPLFMAVRSNANRTALVELLVEHNADLNVQDQAGHTIEYGVDDVEVTSLVSALRESVDM